MFLPQFKVTNLKQVEKDLDKLLRAFTPAEANKILRAGAGLILRSVRKEAPIGPTGNLRKSAKVKTLRARADGRTAVIVAIERKIAPHVHLVVSGTKPRYTTNGRYTGVMPKNEFFDRGVFAVANNTLPKVIEGVKKKVEEVAK